MLRYYSFLSFSWPEEICPRLLYKTIKDKTPMIIQKIFVSFHQQSSMDIESILTGVLLFLWIGTKCSFWRLETRIDIFSKLFILYVSKFINIFRMINHSTKMCNIEYQYKYIDNNGIESMSCPRSNLNLKLGTLSSWQFMFICSSMTICLEITSFKSLRLREIY